MNMTPARLREIHARHWPNLRIAVESGTFEGTTTKLLRQFFAVVHTIELDPQHWVLNLQRHGEIAHFHLGNSGVLIPLLCEAYQDEPVFWFLDAHFTPGLRGSWKMRMAGENAIPLWEELKSLRNRKQPDIIVVDDVHAFGRAGEWQNITRQALDEFLQPRAVETAIVGDQYVAWMGG